MKWIYIVVICCFNFFPVAGFTSGITSLTWEDLIPETAKSDDPLLGLPEEEAGFIEWIIYLREYLPEKIDPENQEFYDEMSTALPELKGKGYDVDKIIAERKRKNSLVNTGLDGKQVSLSGYLLPLDMSKSEIKEFLLVPYVGACIHTPPPPSNQIVHAITKSPIAFGIEKSFRPVTLTGVMKIGQLSKDLYLVDGANSIDIGFSMLVDSIDEYKK